MVDDGIASRPALSLADQRHRDGQEHGNHAHDREIPALSLDASGAVSAPCLTISGPPSSTISCCTGSIRRMALGDSTRSDRARPRSGGLPWACVTRLILDRCYTQGRDTAGDRIRSGFNRSAGARSGREQGGEYECSLCLLYSCDFISIRSADGADRCDWSLGNRDNLQGWKVR